MLLFYIKLYIERKFRSFICKLHHLQFAISVNQSDKKAIEIIKNNLLNKSFLYVLKNINNVP